MEIELARIELNPQQPRTEIDEEALNGLADSIRNAGILQPVVVRPRDDDMYELVMGERRLRAAHIAGLKTVPAIVRKVSDEQMLELALMENVQREDLNPIEKASAMKDMMDQLNLTQAEVGEKLGLNRSTIANFVRLLELPEEVQQMVSRGTLSGGHARTLLALDNPNDQIELARYIADNGLSVRATERRVAGKSKENAGSRPEITPHLKHLRETLRDRLGAKVDIIGKGNKGKIVIHFEGHEQFERLVELIARGEEPPQSAVA
jgi:ParB family chromosome partitioning protein